MRNVAALRSQLTSLEKDVLDELCESRVTRNAVVLTLDLVNRRRILRFGDPYGLVVECVTQLNERGLCVYTEGDHSVPINIRPTRDGYHAAGHLLIAHEAGGSGQFRTRYRRDDAAIRHPGDGTDFRTLRYATTGGPIERMSLAAHLAKYPDHRHFLTEEDAMPPATRFSAETIAHVVELRGSGLTWDAIARATGISRGTLSSPTTVFGRAFQNATHKEEPMAASNTHPSATPEQRDLVVAMIREGATNAAITAATGLGVKAISTAAESAGIYRGPAGRLLTKEEFDIVSEKHSKSAILVGATLTEMLRQAAEGVTPKELGKRFGVGDQAIRNALHNNGWGSAGAGRPLIPPRTNGVTTGVPVNRFDKLKDRHAEMARTAEPIESVPPNLTLREEAQRVTLLRHIVTARAPFHNVGVLTDRANSWQDVRLAGHEIVHVLFDLRKDGLVTFRETSTGGGMRLQKIKTTLKGERLIRQLDSKATNQNQKPEAAAPADQRAAVARIREATPRETVQEPAPTPVVTDTPPTEPTVTTTPWPVLTALRERVAAGAKAKARAERYLEAAALLEDPEGTDALMVKSLIDAAEALGEATRLSNVEAEYLAYSEVCKE